MTTKRTILLLTILLSSFAVYAQDSYTSKKLGFTFISSSDYVLMENTSEQISEYEREEFGCFHKNGKAYLLYSYRSYPIAFADSNVQTTSSKYSKDVSNRLAKEGDRIIGNDYIGTLKIGSYELYEYNITSEVMDSYNIEFRRHTEVYVYIKDNITWSITLSYIEGDPDIRQDLYDRMTTAINTMK